MANFSLDQTYGNNAKDIQTTFRFEIHIRADESALGLTNDVVGYIQNTDLPAATGEPIIWHLPGGMKNHQAGKRTPRPISMTFVVPTTSTSTSFRGSIYRMLEKWAHATYDLNKGTNIGKKRYCTDAISIVLKGEDDTPQYTFELKAAQVTECNYGSLGSETNDLIKVSCTMVYDNYVVHRGGIGGVVLNTSN